MPLSVSLYQTEWLLLLCRCIMCDRLPYYKINRYICSILRPYAWAWTDSHTVAQAWEREATFRAKIEKQLLTYVNRQNRVVIEYLCFATWFTTVWHFLGEGKVHGHIHWRSTDNSDTLSKCIMIWQLNGFLPHKTSSIRLIETQQ